MILWFLGWVGDSFSNPDLRNLLRNLSLIEHYYNFGKGIIDSNDILYYISVIIFFLFLNHEVLSLTPYSTTSRGMGLKIRRREIIYSIIVFIIIFEINFLGFFHSRVWDITRGNRLSLSSQSIQILNKVNEPIEVMMFFTEETPGYFETRNVLEEFSRINPMIKLHIYDPDKEIEKAREYNIKVYGTTVFKQGSKIERTYHKNEMGLINVLFRFVIRERLKVYVLTGHGEHSITDLTNTGLNLFYRRFLEEGYDIEKLDINAINEIPGDATMLLISGSQKEFSEHAIKVIKDYFKTGGNLFLCIDPPPQPDHNWFLNEFGIKHGGDVIIDRQNSLYGISPMIPVIVSFSNHIITQNISDLILPLVSSFSFVDLPKNGENLDFNMYWLAKSSDSSWGEVNLNSQPAEDEKDNKGPLYVAIALEKYYEENKGYSKAVIVGDSDFITNGFINLSENVDFTGNSMNWLSNRDSLIYIRPREGEVGVLRMNPGQVSSIFILVVVLIPLIFILTAILVIFFRKRWRE